MGEQWHFEPDTYLAMVRAEIPAYDDLQAVLADATVGVEATRILDLGSGTGVTARGVLDRHAGAELIGVDASDAMLDHARALVPEGTFLVQQLEERLPAGPFDLVVSAFAVHHLDGRGKEQLFGRVADVLGPGGRFVLCDVVVPTEPVDRPVPIEPGVDRPSALTEQLAWLRATGLTTAILHAQDDLAVVAADRK